VTTPAAPTSPIVRSVEIAAEPERVFELLTDERELVRWWPDVAELEPRRGGRVRFAFRGGESIVTGELTRFDPPHVLALTWIREETPGVTTSVEFTITPLASGRCRVDVVHSGWESAPELRPLHDAGWAHFLGCLAALAEGRPVDKTFPTT
jgi:uncharacterized protein YndB with AHSA1/START domain